MDQISTERVKQRMAWEGGLRATLEATLEYGPDGSSFEDAVLGAAWNAARACYDAARDRWSDDSQAKISVVDLLGK